MTPDEFKAFIAGKIEQRDVGIKQVSRGYVITGYRRFLDPETEITLFTGSVEAACEAMGDAADIAEYFFKFGTFNIGSTPPGLDA